MSLTRVIRQEIGKATRRTAGALRRALVSVAPTTGFFMSAKGLTGEIWTDLELWQQYGLASRPPVGGEVLIARPDSEGGEGSVAIATNDRNHRPSDLAADEVVLYGKSATGQPMIRLKADGNIDILPGTGSTVDIGSAVPVDFMLLGTKFDTADRILVTACQVVFTLLATGFTSIGTAFSSSSTALAALGVDAALSTPTKDACNATVSVLATSIGVITTTATACTTAASACTTFLAGSYLAVNAKVS